MNLSAWPPQNGKVAFQGKLIGSKQVLHFINFANASTFDWRDTDGTQTTPSSIVDANIEVNYSGTATKVWLASPDINFGIPQQLSFTQNGSTVKFTLPSLQYWDMIVIE
jgi:dextranase